MKLFELQSLRAGSSLRFAVDARREGFAVRAPDGSVRAYLNICPHRAQAVDVGDGRLFVDGLIECSAHGARFDPATGACAGGPCDGSPLTPLFFQERDGAVWLSSDAADD